MMDSPQPNTPIRIYLAGPDVFFPGAKSYGQRKKDLCSLYGFQGLFPLDNDVNPGLSAQTESKVIYQGNLGLMAQADAILANITPFRGPNMDPGTAFEVGYFAAHQKPVFLYSNDARSYKARVDVYRDVDAEGLSIEDFGDVENLMIVRAATFPVVCGAVPAGNYYESLVNFESALARMRTWYQRQLAAAIESVTE